MEVQLIVQLIVKQEVYRQEQFYLKSASVGFVFYINKIVMTKKSTWNNILRGCYFNNTGEKKAGKDKAKSRWTDSSFN